MADVININKNALIPIADIRIMAESMAKSNLFGIKDINQAMSLMLIAQAEGLHPAIAARDYDIIQGRPAKKAEAMMRQFISVGGCVEWHRLDDECAEATFSHPQGGKVKINWDMNRARQAGLADKDNYKKWKRQMLRSRCVSEGVRTVCPSATSGLYTPEEVQTMEPKEMGSAEIVRLDEKQEADFLAAIDTATTKEELQDTWKKAAAACQAIHDAEAHAKLKGKVLQRLETLKVAA